jgi:hypothetical protein
LILSSLEDNQVYTKKNMHTKSIYENHILLKLIQKHSQEVKLEKKSFDFIKPRRQSGIYKKKTFTLIRKPYTLLKLIQKHSQAVELQKKSPVHCRLADK